MLEAIRSHPKLPMALKLSVILVPYVVLFAGGLALAVLQSAGIGVPVSPESGLLGSYRSLFANAWFYRSFGFSLYVAFCSAVISVGAGTFLAYRIWRLPASHQRLAVVYKIPLILPHIAVGFLVLLFFSRSGILSSALFRIGIIQDQQEFPAVLYAGNGIGLIMAYTYKEIPFVVLMVSAVLKRFDPRYLLAADMLGARRVYTFLRVVLPYLSPVIHTTGIILFLYSFGAFDIPYLLSESNPEMLSVYVYNLYYKRDLVNRPYAMAVLVTIFLFSVVFIYLYVKTVSRVDRRVRKL